MEYSGEHIFAGQFGKTTVVIAVIAALVATILYLTGRRRKGMLLAASGAYVLHTLALFASCVTLMLMIFGHYVEYNYVWQYTSRDLSNTYLFSAFWAGKEGSMMLWLLLQALAGLVLIARRKVPAGVMGIIAGMQCLLGLTLLNIDAGGFQWGTSPFLLLREIPAYAAMPLFGDPGYLSFLQEGHGLNPLLHNPWMAIHPPVLFLGYALCLIPYAYAVISINSKKEQISIPVFWNTFGAFALGAGLILGGAWAYEDLTFGGFWAWDPVENASLVPWLLTLASLHFLLNPSHRSTGTILSVTPYITVLFAAYLTRSGVLSNTSVHSFSGVHGSELLLILTAVATLIPLLFLVFRKRTTETNSGENLLSSRTWMFIGATFLVLSAFQVLFVTAVPVLNSWFNLHLAPPSDPVSFYNHWQQWFAAGMALCMSMVLYLPATTGTFKTFLKRILPGWITALLAVMLTILFLPALHTSLYFLLYFLLSAVFAMSDGMIRINRKKSNFAAALSHTGFAIFITGAVITFSWQEPMGLTSNSNPNGLQTLVLGQIKPLQKGFVSYAGRTVNGDEIIYRLDFLYKASNGKYYLDYSLYPTIIDKEGMGRVPKPDTRKTWKEDIFVHLSHTEITKDVEYTLRNERIDGKEPADSEGLVQKTDFIVMSARRFPYINLLWAGVVIMAAGMIWSLIKRRKTA